MRVWASVFITATTPGPRKAVRAIRQIPEVVSADALFGAPDVIATVEGSDLRAMDALIDAIVELPEVMRTETKVARWID
jgi:DNA-binding Lrp family transcriptional regulator